MQGLSEILDYISKSTKDECDKILSEQSARDEMLISQAEKKAESLRHEAAKDAKKFLEQFEAGAKAAAVKECQKQQLMLKGQLIEKLLADAKQYILNLGADQYFEFFMQVLKSIDKPKGIIKFNERDLSRIERGILKDYSLLTLSDQPIDIEGGFIIYDGGIIYDMSISALFGEHRDRLYDIAAAKLFE